MEISDNIFLQKLEDHLKYLLNEPNATETEIENIRKSIESYKETNGI